MELAELQTRVDRKYFVPADVFRRLIAELADELQVLEIDGRRTFGYESVYFDTPRPHHLPRARAAAPAAVQGPHPHLHRQRAVHVRGQADRGARGDRQGAGAAPERVPRRAHRRSAGPPGQPRCARPTTRTCRPGCSPTLVTTYRRTTFVSRTGECPADLRRRAGLPRRPARGPRHRHPRAGGEQVRGHGAARADRILRELGVRPAVGEQVLRRRRRPAPRAAVQPVAPDPAALLRAAECWLRAACSRRAPSY